MKFSKHLGMEILGIIIILTSVIGSLIYVILSSLNHLAAEMRGSSGPSITLEIIVLIGSLAIFFIGTNFYDNFEIFKNKSKKTSKKAKITFICGLITLAGLILTSIIPFLIKILFFISLPLLVLTFVFGILAKKEIKEKNLKGKGYAISGIILGVVYLIIPLLIAIVTKIIRLLSA